MANDTWFFYYFENNNNNFILYLWTMYRGEMGWKKIII